MLGDERLHVVSLVFGKVALELNIILQVVLVVPFASHPDENSVEHRKCCHCLLLMSCTCLMVNIISNRDALGNRQNAVSCVFSRNKLLFVI